MIRDFFAGVRGGIRRDPLIWLLLVAVAAAGLYTGALVQADDAVVAEMRRELFAAAGASEPATPPVAAPAPRGPAPAPSARQAPARDETTRTRPAPPARTSKPMRPAPAPRPEPERAERPKAGSGLDVRTRATRLIGQGRACEAADLLKGHLGDSANRSLYDYARSECRGG